MYSSSSVSGLQHGGSGMGEFPTSAPSSARDEARVHGGWPVASALLGCCVGVALPQVAVDSCLCTPQAKPPELVEAYTSGKADYYGLYKRNWAADEDVTFGAAVKGPA